MEREAREQQAKEDGKQEWDMNIPSNLQPNRRDICELSAKPLRSIVSMVIPLHHTENPQVTGTYTLELLILLTGVTYPKLMPAKFLTD